MSKWHNKLYAEDSVNKNVIIVEYDISTADCTVPDNELPRKHFYWCMSCEYMTRHVNIVKHIWECYICKKNTAFYNGEQRLIPASKHQKAHSRCQLLQLHLKGCLEPCLTENSLQRWTQKLIHSK